jgi:hypothetical protein
MASEAGHWYTKQGEPAYTVVGKNGKERPTTVRDARKMGLVPSVTTVIKEAYSFSLENWKINQAIMAALTMPMPEVKMSAEDLVAKIRQDSQEQAKKAAERGTHIHAVIQSAFEGNPVSADDAPYCASAANTLLAGLGETGWVCEQSFATARYGGKVDLHTDKYLIDIKTTDKPLDGLKVWDSHAMQLAAYDNGLSGIRQCGILDVNSVSAEARLLLATPEEILRGWRCFVALLNYWYAKNNL